LKVYKITKNGKALIVVSLIIGIIGAGIGGFYIAKDYFITKEPYILPMARA